MTGVAVLAAGIAVWFLVGPARGAAAARLLSRGAPEKKRRGPWWRWAAPGAGVALVVGWFLPFGSVVVAGVMVAATVAWVVGRRRTEKRALVRVKETARVCQVLESLLALGHVPAQAVVIASEECPMLAGAANTQRMGGDVAHVLTALGELPGGSGMRDVARAWIVTERTGAPLHGTLARVRVNVSEQADLAVTIKGELAEARATGQLLSVLPLFGIGVAVLLGGDPWGFFTTNLLGRICLIAGIGLACAGVIWNERVATAAMGQVMG